MFYRMYLSSVCQRRHWSEPAYEPYRNRGGYYCKVVVNNREYCTDVPYETEELSRDGAAMKAFMICRNFSSNDGYYPGQRPGQKSASGIAQGVPVPIGTGRRGNHRISGSSYDTFTSSSSFSSSDGTNSGSNSPKSIESAFDESQLLARPPPAPPAPMPNVVVMGRRQQDEYLCMCRRGPIRAYGRCDHCLRASGWR